MGNTAVKSEPRGLNNETLKIKDPDGTTYFLTKSAGRFAHYCRLLDSMESAEYRIITGNFELSYSDDEEDDDEEDYDEDEYDDSGEDDLTDGSDALDMNSGRNDVEEQLPNDTYVVNLNAEEDGGVRNRASGGKRFKETNHNTTQGGSDHSSADQDNNHFVKIESEDIYDAFRLFEMLRGMDGSLMFSLKNMVEKERKTIRKEPKPKLNESLTNNRYTTNSLIPQDVVTKEYKSFYKEKYKREAREELYNWCKDHFSEAMECYLMTETAINRCEVILGKLDQLQKNSLPTNENGNTSTANPLDAIEQQGCKVEELLHLIQDIQKKKKEMIDPNDVDKE